MGNEKGIRRLVKDGHLSPQLILYRYADFLHPRITNWLKRQMKVKREYQNQQTEINRLENRLLGDKS
jgi:hypothetical protein